VPVCVGAVEWWQRGPIFTGRCLSLQ